MPDITGNDLCLGLLLQPVFNLLDRCRCGFDARPFGQAHLNQHFGTIRRREELLLDKPHSGPGEKEGKDNKATCQEFVTHGITDQPAKTPIIRCVINRVMATFNRLDRRQHLDAEIGCENHRHKPGDNKRETDNPEDITGIFTSTGTGETNRHQTNDRHQCTGKHRGCGVAPGIGRGLDAVHTLFHFDHHDLDGDDGVIDKQAKRQNKCAKRDPIKKPAGFQHDQKDNGKSQRNSSRNNDPHPPAKTDQAHQQNNPKRHGEFHHEFADGRVDIHGLVTDFLETDTKRQCLGDGSRPVFQCFAQFQPVPTLLHHHRQQKCRFSVMTDNVGRRIFIATTNLGDIRKLQRTATGNNRRIRDGLDAVIGAIKPKEDLRTACID